MLYTNKCKINTWSIVPLIDIALPPINFPTPPQIGGREKLVVGRNGLYLIYSIYLKILNRIIYAYSR